jgi:hypothetical protein
VTLVTASISVFTWNQISIEPVAELSSLPSHRLAAFQTDVRPISEIKETAKTDPDAVWAGYVVKLRDLCRISISDTRSSQPTNETVILVRDPESQTLTAATVNFGSSLCKKLEKKADKEQLYATSDVPFSGIPSQKQFLVLRPDKIPH